MSIKTYIYSINRDTAYNDPVYVHSYEESLKGAMNSKNSVIKKDLNKILKGIQSVYQVSLTNANKTAGSLKKATEELKNSGVSLDNLFGEAGEIFNDYIQPLRNGTFFKNYKTNIQYSLTDELLEEIEKGINNPSNSKKTLGEIIRSSATETLQEITVKTFEENFNRGRKKRTRKLKADNITVENFNKKIKERLKGEGLQALYSELKEKVIHSNDSDIIAFFNNIADSYTELLDRFKDYSFLTNENYSKAINRIKDIVNSKYNLFQKLGFLNEVIVFHGLSLRLNNTDIVGEDKHYLTTDVQGVLGKIPIGVSVKLNEKFFRKTGVDLYNKDFTSAEAKELTRWITDKTEISEGYKIVQALKYFLINYKAFRTFHVEYRVPKGDSGDGEEGVEKQVTNSKKDTDVLDLIEEVRKALFLGIVIKTLIGYAYSGGSITKKKDVVEEQVNANKSIPLILFAGDKAYWTIDILNNCIEIANDLQRGNRNIKDFIYYSNPDPIKPKSEGDLKEKLKELYRAKRTIVAKEEKRENESQRARYARIKERVQNILTQISGLFELTNAKSIHNLLLKKWSIRYDYRNLQSKGGK